MQFRKWYLVYQIRETWRNGSVDEITTKEVLLVATNEEEAVAEALEKWNEQLDQARAWWEHQKEAQANPPVQPFTDGPWTPCVFYKIALQSTHA